MKDAMQIPDGIKGAFATAWGAGAVLLLGWGIVAGRAQAGPPESPIAPESLVVHPTGYFPDDVGLVQAALDQGGTVLLKAVAADGTLTAFNFGPPEPGSGHVVLTRDVRILGENGRSGRTTIRGGHVPIRSFEGISSEVRGVAFEGPLRFAMLFNGPPWSETIIIGNRVTGLIGQYFPEPAMSFAEAVVVCGGGNVIVTDNVVEGIESDQGIGITQCFGTGPVEISRNHVISINGIGIESTGNLGRVTIADNLVEPGATGFFATGIEVNGTGTYHVVQNAIRIDHPFGVAVLAFGPGEDFFGFGDVTAPVIERNAIVIHSLFDAIELIGTVSDTYAGENRISGQVGDTAFWLQGWGSGSGPASNTFVGNSVAGLETGFATVFMDELTRNTLIVGRTGTIVDLGTNNRYTGFRGGPGSGLQVRDAVARRNALLRDAHSHPASSFGLHTSARSARSDLDD